MCKFDFKRKQKFFSSFNFSIKVSGSNQPFFSTLTMNISYENIYEDDQFSELTHSSAL